MADQQVKWFLVTAFCGALLGCGGGGSDGEGPAYSKASLDGRYYGNYFNYNHQGKQSAIESVTFDGNGVLGAVQQISFWDDATSTQGTDTVSAAADYDVDTDGSATFSQDGEVTDGIIGAGANAVVAARINDTEVHNLNFFIKASAPGAPWAGDLRGSYHAIGFRDHRTEVTKLTFHPDGTFDATGYFTDETDIRKTDVGGGGTWVIDDDGKATVTGAGGGADPVWFSADGSLFVSAGASATSGQKIFIGMKAGSGHKAADLKGTYGVARVSSRSSGHSCSLGTLTFDGKSGVTVHASWSDPTSSGTSDLTGTYKVNADGTFSITMQEDTPLDAVMSADGSTIAFAKMDSTDRHDIAVAVRR